ncbi:hypothetical protein MFC_01462 [Mesomycoplasma flocculare ATCC 27716]|uniref:Uncharacterized protein n=1 Tax=Mesomycoplasma flocculare ATCC 27399 TaxID=743971 RepID=A0A0A8E766_MESFC|nr:hypothetical protein MYF_01718 [Mesomycoplasma flocculare ATCC 27399]ENX51195.1 hypothetical protein MFC_01462 [Mesomycoplasma flocculare ATCC 27716]
MADIYLPKKGILRKKTKKIEIWNCKIQGNLTWIINLQNFFIFCYLKFLWYNLKRFHIYYEISKIIINLILFFEILVLIPIS